MNQNTTIVLEIDDNRLAKSLFRDLSGVSGIELSRPGMLKGNKDVSKIVLADDDNSGSILLKLPALRRQYSNAAIFVISPNKNPQHIVEVMKAGGAEYIMAPAGKEQLVRAIDEAKIRGSNFDDMHSAPVYSFISSKGGLGATFLAVNSAEAMALKNKKNVALWDMCFQSGDSNVLLDIVPETTIYDISKNIERLDFALLKSSMARKRNGIEVLCSPLRAEEGEEIRVEHITKVTNIITKLYDSVFVDSTSMAMTENSMAVFKYSRKIFIVIDLTVSAIRNANRIYELISQMEGLVDVVEFVVNRHTSDSNVSIEEAEESLKKKIYWIFPNDFKRVSTSVEEGEPLVVSEPRSSLAKNIFDFVGKIEDPKAYEKFRGYTKRRLLGSSYSMI